MSDPTPVMPLLSSTVDKITNVQEVTASFIRFVLLNPGNISDYVEDELISFRYLASKFGDNKNELCEVLKVKVSSVLQRYFPDYTVIADFTHFQYNDDEEETRYGVKFDISYLDKNKNTIPGIRSGMFTVETDGRITINLNNEE